MNLHKFPGLKKGRKNRIAFAKSFGEKLGLETIVDRLEIFIIHKPATPGMEKENGRGTGHLDIVPQKNANQKA
ncbi:MAG: hypothetical protein H6540_00145 [Bacteroidales bacterium]|nr:hypothetical protein [Bacteroidales bacterium]